MARKRMFDLNIVDSDLFLDMPQSTRLLYYDLSMRADDDGFVGNPKKIARTTGASDDDLRILFTKKFVIPFQTGICVIRHWKINNYLRKDRYTPTIYQEEKQQLIEQESGVYDIGIPMVDQMATQYSKEENSIEEYSIEEKEVQEKEEKICTQTIYDFIKSEFGRTLSPTEYEFIENWEDTELTRYAIKQAILNGAPRIKYIQTILDSYKTKNIKSVQEAQKDEENYKKNKSKSKQGIEPEWLDQEVEKEEITKEEKEKLEELLKEFK